MGGLARGLVAVFADWPEMFFCVRKLLMAKTNEVFFARARAMSVQILTLSLILGSAACGSSSAPDSTPTSDIAASQDVALDPANWPRDFVAGYGDGPALFLTEDRASPAFGYLEPGTPIRIGSLPTNGRIKVRVDGPVKVRGWIPMERLALRVAQAGRIPDTPISVSPGNLLRYLGPTEDPAIARVEGRARLSEIRAPAYQGVFPVDRLTAAAVDVVVPTGDYLRLPEAQVSLYASPTETIATLPAVTGGLLVQVAADRGEWKAVRIGDGPYMVGYVNAELAPTQVTETASESSDFPRRLNVDADRPLWRVRAGTRVRFGEEGAIIAVLETDAYAREMGRFENGEVDVFLAATNAVSVRGLVPVDALTEVGASVGLSTSSNEPEVSAEP